MTRTLLDITADLQALDDLLAQADGDISNPDVGAAIEMWFAELDQDLAGKVDNYAALITTMEARAELRDAEAKRLAQRSRIDDHAADFLRFRLKQAMESRGMKKIETARYRVSVANNGGKLPVVIDDEKRIAKAFYRMIEELDREKIREALEAGKPVDGARLGERGTRLSIK